MSKKPKKKIERGTKDYTKPALSYQEQLDLLISRGLKISNKNKGFALNYLEYKSYYRLSGFWYPLLDKKKEHIFEKDARFIKAIMYYEFDKILRKVVLNEIEKIEIALKAKMVYIMSYELKSTEPWYLDSKYYKNRTDYEKDFVNNLEERTIGYFERSRDTFVTNFLTNYSGNPPSWILFETLDMGYTSLIFYNLKEYYGKQISSHFKLPLPIMTSWMHTLSYIRNICAHHSRLWNKELSIEPRKVYILNQPWINMENVDSTKLYYSLAIIQYFLNTIELKHRDRFNKDLDSLLKEFSDVDPKMLGFPENWKLDPFWKFDTITEEV